LNKKLNKVIIYLIFFITIFVVGLNLISIIFPVFIISIASPNENNLELFELGANYDIFIITNILIFCFFIFYYKKKLPIKIQNTIQSILVFETSKKITLISIIVILTIYISFTTPDLFLDEESNWPDYEIFKNALEIWPFGESSNPYTSEQKDRHVRMFLLVASLEIFQNVKIIPFIASILLLIVTYFFTVKYMHLFKNIQLYI